MNKYFVSILVLGFIIISGFVLINLTQSKPKEFPTPQPQTITTNPTVEKIAPFKAKFTIITGNITRSFKDQKYHNKSPDVYIDSSDPSTVIVTKKGTTWDDFFKTLPMQLTNECLITGDAEKLCSSNGKTLKFYLNNIETPNLLDLEIKEKDLLEIKYI